MKIKSNQFWKSKPNWYKQFGWGGEGWTIKIGVVKDDLVYCRDLQWENRFVVSSKHVLDNYEEVENESR